MTSQPITVRLQPRRLEQLKAIAAALDLSVAEAVSHMIREKIVAGIIPNTIPGIVVRRADDAVHIQIDEGAAVAYAPEVAREIASTIQNVVDGGSATVSIQHNYSVTRVGTGFKLLLPLAGNNGRSASVFSRDLALDLARLIEQAAE